LPIELGELKDAGIDWSLLGFDGDELAKLLDPGVKAGLDDLDAIRIPEPRIRAWFRDAIEAMFDDVTTAEAERRRLLAKRRSELANMQDRLLNAFLQGVVDEAAFNAKSAELKAQLAEVERQLDGAGAVTEENGRLALSVFDFSQNLADIWRGSNFASRRTILECVSSNRLLSGASLVLIKRRAVRRSRRTALLQQWSGRLALGMNHDRRAGRSCRSRGVRPEYVSGRQTFEMQLVLVSQ
jgi:hypothetical protein